jgi:hypothetical protein
LVAVRPGTARLTESNFHSAISTPPYREEHQWREEDIYLLPDGSPPPYFWFWRLGIYPMLDSWAELLQYDLLGCPPKVAICRLQNFQTILQDKNLSSILQYAGLWRGGRRHCYFLGLLIAQY